MSAEEPTPIRTKSARPRAMAVVAGLIVAIAAVGVVAVLLLPWQNLSSQRRSIDHATETLARLQAETSHLDQRVAEAKDPVVVERIAREQLSLVREGDTLYRLNVDPADAVSLPLAWPLPGVAHLLGGADR